jgi:hypothetical protein
VSDRYQSGICATQMPSTGTKRELSRSWNAGPHVPNVVASVRVHTAEHQADQSRTAVLMR